MSRTSRILASEGRDVAAVRSPVGAPPLVELAKPALAPSDVRLAKLEPLPSVAEGLEAALRRHGPGAPVALLPLGPLKVPYIAET